MIFLLGVGQSVSGNVVCWLMKDIMAHRSLKFMRALVCTTTTILIMNMSCSSMAATGANQLTSQTIQARSKILEFNDEPVAGENSTSQEQRLALQIIITEPSEHSKGGQKSKRPPASILLARKRPYDLQETLSNNIIEKYSPLAKHFYVLEPPPTSVDKSTTTTTTTKVPSYPPTLPTGAPSISRTTNNDKYQQKHHQLDVMQNKQQSKDKLLTKRPAAVFNQRSELLRTQHRPPWLPRLAYLGANSAMLDQQSEMEVRKYFLKFRTTLAPMIPTSTEFFKLMSSAHSPLKNKLTSVVSVDALVGRTNSSSDKTREMRPISDSENYTATQRQQTSTPVPRGKHSADSQKTSESALYPRYSPTSGANTSAPNESTSTSRVRAHPTAGSVMSPTIMFGAGDGNATLIASDAEKLESSVSRGQTYELDDRRGPSGFSTTLGPNETPLAYSDGKKIITLVRHRQRIPPTTTTTRVPFITPPSRIIVQEHTATPSSETNKTEPQSTVRLISKQRLKYDDRIISPTLTVVDNAAVRLPPNATSVHNNKLIVAIRPGRPNRRHPSTTQFPVYNIVAGITPPFTNVPSQMQFTRPPSIDGSVYGLLKPTGPDAITTTPSPSQFGAPNIKFPAASPPPTSSLLQPPANELHVVESIDKMNISVPASSSNSVIPDRIFMETEEQHISRPATPMDAIVTSNSTIVSRPHGTSTVNQDGIIRLSTTRRPQRVSTTKRINIVSANTTIVATNADQLHDVLNNFISGTHQQHQTSQRPPDKPGFFASLSNLLNASVTTSAVAVLTLIKTIFVAVLIMFLPPIALTAAIMQAIDIG